MRCALAALLLAAAMVSPQPAWAQDDDTEDTRPALPTFWGDTGLWFVPTADVPRSGGVSFSVYRTEFGFNQGFTNVSFFPATVSVGVGDRLEIFGALRVITRIDRDVRPLFYPEPPNDGGVLNDYPFVREVWTGNDLGDLRIGAKVNLLSQYRDWPVSLALRGTMKIPTADSETGAGTGELDYFGDLILSREVGRRVDLTGFAGFVMRGDPDIFDLSDSFRWGVGAGFGTRGNFRLTAELFGETPYDDVITASISQAAADGSFPPLQSKIETDMATNFGITWQHSSGIALGAGMTYRFETDDRSDIFPQFEDRWQDHVGWQFRVAYHPGVRTPLPLAPPPTPPAPLPPAPGAVAPAPPPAPGGGQPPAPGAVQPVAPAPGAAGALVFDDVLFDFDMSTLRPDALATLQRVIAALRANPGLRFMIEGHASAEGTAEYNLSLGERRAVAVRDYIVSQGIDGSRLMTATFGEERPKFDNAIEGNRALNRRAAFVVRAQ